MAIFDHIQTIARKFGPRLIIAKFCFDKMKDLFPIDERVVVVVAQIFQILEFPYLGSIGEAEGVFFKLDSTGVFIRIIECPIRHVREFFREFLRVHRNKDVGRCSLRLKDLSHLKPFVEFFEGGIGLSLCTRLLCLGVDLV